MYTGRERAALRWCEALTLIADSSDRDDAFREVQEQFDEREIVLLTLAVATINARNRLNEGLHASVGDYRSRHQP